MLGRSRARAACRRAARAAVSARCSCCRVGALLVLPCRRAARAAVSAHCSWSCRRRQWPLALRRRRLVRGRRASRSSERRARTRSGVGKWRRSSATPLVKPRRQGAAPGGPDVSVGSASAAPRERGRARRVVHGACHKTERIGDCPEGRPLGAVVEAQVEVGSTFLTECRKPPPASTSDDASRCQRSAASPGRGSRTPRRKKSTARGGICSGMGPLRNVEAHEAEVCSDASAGAPVTNLSGVFSS
jgi:hypothetical protein